MENREVILLFQLPRRNTINVPHFRCHARRPSSLELAAFPAGLCFLVYLVWRLLTAFVDVWDVSVLGPQPAGPNSLGAGVNCSRAWAWPC